MKLSEAIEKYGDCEVKQELIDLIDTKPETIYDLKKGDEYYVIENFGNINRCIFYNNGFDNARLNISNIYLTKKEAETAIEKLKVEAILRKHSYNFSEEEWNKCSVDKHYIEYATENNIIDIECVRHLKLQGTIYFKTVEDCQKAINEIGKERLINYFNGVL